MYLSEANSDLFWASIGWLIAFLQVLVVVTGHPELGADRYAWVILVITAGLLGFIFQRFFKKSAKFRM